MATTFKDKIPKWVIGAGITTAAAGLIPISFGFGTAGVIAGTAAATTQSMIGSVTAGSLFAICTSLGMIGVFSTTAAVGAILGAGGLIAFIKQRFDPRKDAELINTIINEGDNPELIIKLLESRFPVQRELTRQVFNILSLNNNLDIQVLLYTPINLRIHVVNLLRATNTIFPQTPPVQALLNNLPFNNYFINEFNAQNDANLINTVINNNDNPLIIVRLLNCREESQRKDIDKEFRQLQGNNDIKMIHYIRNFMPIDPELPYLFALLN